MSISRSFCASEPKRLTAEARPEYMNELTRKSRDRRKIGILSDDVKLTAVLTSALGSEYAVSTPFQAARARELAADETLSAIILDIGSGTVYGEDAAAIVDDLCARAVPVVVMTDDENRQYATDLLQHGVHSCVRKPPAIRDLKAALQNACDSRTLKAELAAAQRRLETTGGLDQLVGSGPQMQLVYKLIRKVTDLNASVLITGESGTGKELIARAIHNTGSRADLPFVAVSCGAIPETLIESELFGHEKGSFTGATGAREGYFEKAGNGTLFLDEIGELNPQIQVKLLRVLQQREFQRLGSSRAIPLRARVVLATHRDLPQMVAAGEFRQDLFYRVNVMNIKSPALRHHPEDIPVLADHFIRKYATTYGKDVDGVDPEAIDLLQTYSWPGNIRELENVIQRALIMTEGNRIEASDLPDVFQDLEAAEAEEALPSGSFERMLRDYKVKLANDAISQCNGNKTLAAQKLSISRAYLHRLIRLGDGVQTETPIPAAEIARPRLFVAAVG
jgi:DNA-binding NtrC family response regulator